MMSLLLFPFSACIMICCIIYAHTSCQFTVGLSFHKAEKESGKTFITWVVIPTTINKKALHNKSIYTRLLHPVFKRWQIISKGGNPAPRIII